MAVTLPISRAHLKLEGVVQAVAASSGTDEFVPPGQVCDREMMISEVAPRSLRRTNSAASVTGQTLAEPKVGLKGWSCGLPSLGASASATADL